MKQNKLLKIAIPLTIVALAGAGTGVFWMFYDSNTSPALASNSPGGLSGIVVDGLSDTPISGASVMARKLNAPINTPREGVVCNEHGHFILELSDGEWLIEPSVKGYVKQGRSDTGREIEITNGTQFVNAKLQLWPAAGLRGRIVTGDVGIQAEIELIYETDASGAENYTYKTLTTDQNGVFVIDNAYGGMTTLTAAAEGFANVSLNNVELNFGQTLDLGDIPMRDGVSLFGRITDNVSQKGILDAQITMKNADGILLDSITTDTAGNSRLPPLDMGQVTIHIAADGYHPTSRRLELSGNANREMNFELKRAWGLTLDVQNMTGRDPIKTHLKITDVTTNHEVYTKIVQNGKITLDDIEGGPYLIIAESYDKMTSQTIRLTAGDNARIVLKPFARIEGIAKQSNGSPLTDGEYRYAFMPEPSAEESVTPWYALASSEFEIPDLPEGYYRVELRRGTDAPVSSPVFQLKHGDIRHLTLQMTEGGVLKGHVVTTESGFGVRAQVKIEGTELTAQTDRDGYFTIDKLPTRPFTVMIKPNRESEYTSFEGITVKDNTTVEREFRVVSERTEQRVRRRQEMEERIARGEMPAPPWGDGPPPWGDGPPPWGDGPPPMGDGHPPWGDRPPPWGDGPRWEAPPNRIGDQPELPMNEDGTLATPPRTDGKPPWGDGPPPWEVNGGRDIPSQNN